jgi:hypothetical protein
MPSRFEIVIPEPLQPLERGELYDLPLCDLFDELDDGEVVGGGTLVSDGTINECIVEFEIDNIQNALPGVLNVIASANAPAGTTLVKLDPERQELYRVD